MKIKLIDYIRKLVEIAEKHPETKEFLVISAIDEEGNGFDYPFCYPTIGTYNEESGHFEADEFNVESNTICLN